MNLFPVHGDVYIIITSIFEPTKAIQKFAKYKGYKIVVVGDKKTPKKWQYPNVKFLSIENQKIGKMAELLPYNHYCRKMVGYIYAIQQGAEIIFDTDDDNIPYPYFPQLENKPYHQDIWNQQWNTIDENLGFVNICQLYTKQKIWPRGLPLSLINTNFNLEKKVNKKDVRVGIWQGLADMDPDVDAIYRLVDGTECIFEKNDPVVLDKGTVSPYNSQNTFCIRELFALLYLPVTVTFRFTDILRSMIAQPIMWLFGYQLGYCGATVYQERNAHNYFADFQSEIPMYLHIEKALEVTQTTITKNQSLSDNLYNVYNALEKEKIVEKKEMQVLNAWLQDIEQL